MNRVEDADRIPELDGLRGLAILLVMIYHIIPYARPLSHNPFLNTTLVQAVSMGWAGVDLFFVLSGFLITSILLRTRNDPHYFLNFYARRVLRIFPLYYLVLGIVYFYMRVIEPNPNPIFQAGLPFSMLYLQNWVLIPKISTHFSASIHGFLTPTWSLAIEEQFYFVWPSIVYLLGRRKLVATSISIVVLTFLARVALVLFASSWKSLEDFIYYSTFTRFDGLCVGALIAIAFQHEKGKQLISRFAWPVLLISLAGIIAIVGAHLDNSAGAKNPYMEMWGYTSFALGFGALIVLVTTSEPAGLLRTFFRKRVLGFFGKYSYSIYLIHAPITILVFDRIKRLHANGDIIWFTYVSLCFGLSILGSLLTWQLLEKWALGFKKYFAYQPTSAQNQDRQSLRV